MSDSISRRALMGAVASAPLGRVLGANDRISVGIIGAGGRGTFDMMEVAKAGNSNAAVTAICDVWRPNRERAAALAAKTFNVQPRQTTDYRELLSWKDVDAVVITTPDFGHATILKAAVEAGKDVYCEKPFATDFVKGREAYLAVKKSDCVVQVGSQRRSDGRHIAAAKLVRSGALGKITRIEIDVAFQHQRWFRPYQDVRESDVAWREFLMDLPARPFDPRLLRQWQLFRATSNGIPGLWMSHLVDTVQWFMDEPYPSGAVSNGGVYLWKDGRETTDVFQTLIDYPKGFLFSFSMVLTNAGGNRNMWFGTRGTLEGFIEEGEFKVSGNGSTGPDRIASEMRLDTEPTTSHMQDFLDCVRTRKTPRADYQAGFSHAVAGCMSAQALENGRRVQFDRERLEIVV
jgi:predicted dehydrogenase